MRKVLERFNDVVINALIEVSKPGSFKTLRVQRKTQMQGTPNIKEQFKCP